MYLKFLLTYLRKPFAVNGKRYSESRAALYDNGMKAEVTKLCTNSADAVLGAMFIALRGFTADGHDYIDDAVARGASFILAEKEVPLPPNVTLVVVDDTRAALADIAAAFYKFPAKSLVIVGITGTNGKTTTANLCQSILGAAGHNVGVISTIDWRYNDKVVPSNMTTPNALELQSMLFEMKEAGVTHVVMEVSSHAIDLERISNCFLDVAALTNLTQDHLDYHGSMAAYGAVKARLFTDYLRRLPKKDTAVAVINTGHSFGANLYENVAPPKLSVAVNDPTAAVFAENVAIDVNGIKAKLNTKQGLINVESRLIGAYNLENLLVAAGIGLALKLSLASIEQGLNSLKHVAGRLHRVPNSHGIGVFVDYAHTPDALENVLKTLAALSPKRLICVFGCGGNRDKTKRPLMGGIAAKYSNIAVVTSDNPRDEEPQAIIDDILGGMQNAKGEMVVEPRRALAIDAAVQQSQAGDIILIAGKGHEDYQIVKGVKHHFDDVEEAQKALENKA